MNSFSWTAFPDVNKAKQLTHYKQNKSNKTYFIQLFSRIIFFQIHAFIFTFIIIFCGSLA